MESSDDVSRMCPDIAGGDVLGLMRQREIVRKELTRSIIEAALTEEEMQYLTYQDRQTEESVAPKPTRRRGYYLAH